MSILLGALILGIAGILLSNLGVTIFMWEYWAMMFLFVAYALVCNGIKG